MSIGGASSLQFLESWSIFFKDCSMRVRLIVGLEKEKLNAVPVVSEAES